jgi:hypothetical protein
VSAVVEAVIGGTQLGCNQILLFDRQERVVSRTKLNDASQAVLLLRCKLPVAVEIARCAFVLIAAVCVVGRNEHNGAERRCLKEAHRSHGTRRVANNERLLVASKNATHVRQPDASLRDVRVRHALANHFDRLAQSVAQRSCDIVIPVGVLDVAASISGQKHNLVDGVHGCSFLFHISTLVKSSC